ncbi:MAG: universal stress protein, partial [Proteobacteria bacterium]|nr:universal stress protein [Pseudomonadota bacterium]
MYSKMLIAVDGTDASRHALKQALMLARTEEASVTLVAVVPAYDGDLRLLGDKRALKSMREPYEQALAAARELAKAEGLSVDAILLEGDPVEKILTAAEQARVDIITLGKRGNYYSDLIPIGSVASKVARMSETDVLLIPPHKNLGLNTILVPFDGSIPAHCAAERGIDIAARYGSVFCLATVYELPLVGFVHDPGLDKKFYDKAVSEQESILLMARAKELLQIKPIIRQGVPVHSVLKELIMEEDIGLVVMSHVGRGNLHHLIMGKVTERLIG